MDLSFFRSKGFKESIRFILKFFVLYSIVNYSSLFIIGAHTPKGFYSPTIDRYFYFHDNLASLFLEGTKWILEKLGYHPERIGTRVLRLSRGGIRINNACLGIAIFAFWFAFVGASVDVFKKKIAWILLGWLVIICLNLLRFTLLLYAKENQWLNPRKFPHHSLFNAIIYCLLIGLIYLYYKKTSSK